MNLPFSPPSTAFRRVRLLALAGSTLLPIPALAAPAPRSPISLEAALARLDQSNPDIAAARASAESAGARAEAASRALWPRLELVSDWSSTDNPVRVFGEKLNRGSFAIADFAIGQLNDPASTSHLHTHLALEAPVDVFGRIRSAAKAEAGGAIASEALAREKSDEIRFAAIRAWHEALLASRAVAVAERAVDAARGREKETEARVTEGAALSADLLRVKARRRALEGDLAERRGDAAIALVNLDRLLGARPGEGFVPDGEIPAPPPLAGTPEEWVETALARRPALSAAADAAGAAHAGADAERKSRLPEFLLYGQYQDDRQNFSSGGQSYTVAAALRLSVFDATRASRLAAAEAAARSADEQARSAVSGTRLEVEAAWRRAEAARERYAAAAGGAEEGREALRVIRERRAAGMATLTDELETETAALAAELEELRSATAVVIADADLERAAGGRRP